MENNLVFLNESFYGKTTNIKKMESYLNNLKNISTVKEMNKSETIENLEDLIANTFNFKEVIFSVDPALYTNAWTYCFFVLKDINDKVDVKLIEDKNGVRFNSSKSKKLYITITHGAMKECTAPQLTALLLHEIGHNFFMIPKHYKLAVSKFRINQYIDVLLELMSYLTFSKVSNNDPNKVITELIFQYIDTAISFLSFFNFGLYTKIKKFIKGNTIAKSLRIIYRIFRITSLIKLPILLVKKMIALFIKNFNSLGYAAERYADQFATSYGYGVELNSALASFSKNDEKDALSIIDRCLGDFIATINFLDDPHPSNVARIKQTIEKLEYELKSKKLFPEHKKEIEKQIKDLNELLNNKDKINKVEKMLDNIGYNKAIDTITSIGVKDKDLYDIVDSNFNNPDQKNKQ